MSSPDEKRLDKTPALPLYKVNMHFLDVRFPLFFVFQWANNFMLSVFLLLSNKPVIYNPHWCLIDLFIALFSQEMESPINRGGSRIGVCLRLLFCCLSELFEKKLNNYCIFIQLDSGLKSKWFFFFK